jgi:hypothetical protein
MRRRGWVGGTENNLQAADRGPGYPPPTAVRYLMSYLTSHLACYLTSCLASCLASHLACYLTSCLASYLTMLMRAALLPR